MLRGSRRMASNCRNNGCRVECRPAKAHAPQSAMCVVGSDTVGPVWTERRMHTAALRRCEWYSARQGSQQCSTTAQPSTVCSSTAPHLSLVSATQFHPLSLSRCHSSHFSLLTFAHTGVCDWLSDPRLLSPCRAPPSLHRHAARFSPFVALRPPRSSYRSSATPLRPASEP